MVFDAAKRADDVVVLPMRGFTLSSTARLRLTGDKPIILAVYGNAELRFPLIDAMATPIPVNHCEFTLGELAQGEIELFFRPGLLEAWQELVVQRHLFEVLGDVEQRLGLAVMRVRQRRQIDLDGLRLPVDDECHFRHIGYFRM